MMKKRRWRSGFTLSETLITLAILAVVTAGGAAVTQSVLGTRMEMLEIADAQILASTVLESLADEVRFGQNIRIEEETPGTGETITTMTLNSTRFGMDVSFSADVTDTDGKVMAKGPSITGNQEKLLTTWAYTSLKVDGLKFERDGDNIKITFKVVNNRKTVLWEDSLTVTPLNGFKVIP